MSIKYGVFIGRFQPFHNGHLAVVNDALSKVDKLIIVIGSANAARNVRNPWTSAERQEMIVSCLLDQVKAKRIEFAHVNDYTYNDNMWVSQIQNKIDELTDGSDDVTLFGRNKDHTTYYLSLFPQWKLSPAQTVPDMDATSIRTMYFQQDLHGVAKRVPPQVLGSLETSAFVSKSIEYSPTFLDLQGEYEYYAQYKKDHSWADPKLKYRPSHNTVDAVVIKSGHVLLVRRKFRPGRGLMALPGGFVSETETTFDACIRELKEETGIQVPPEELRKCLVADHVFDDPERSLRGRTFTFAFAFNLGSGKLPRVKGSDDAEKAFWLPINDVVGRGSEFFEDHCHIVQYFSNRF